jgi:hypothetical protein
MFFSPFLLFAASWEGVSMCKTQKHNFASQRFAKGVFPIAAVWEAGLHRRHDNQNKITLAAFQYDRKRIPYGRRG